MRWLVTLTLFGLLARLVSLSVIDHQYYLELARGNRVKVIRIPQKRGSIFDRQGQVLAQDKTENLREYPLGAAASQVIGFVGEDGVEITGKDGLERFYNDQLKGKAGGVLVETGADGRIVREIGRTEPQSGENLTTTLDLGLQQLAYKLLLGKKGAVVATAPDSGEVLALVSSPGFRPDKVASSLSDPDLPLFNRAISGVYPPGSTFKIITAVAGLEEGVIDGQTEIEDQGTVKIDKYEYANWYYTQYGRIEGWLNVAGALKRSNDIFFYRLGEKLGARVLSDWGKYFDLGRPTGIDLPGEAEGLMPDPDWKQKVKKEPWYLGDTLITAIGQGNILMTPLQVNTMTSIIAGNSRWCRPHLVGELDCKQLDIQPETIRLVTKGMIEVAQPGGTAFPFFDFPVSVAGKTGTAEYGLSAQAGDPENKTHAWFTAFAPADNPNIVVTVLLEGAGEGSAEAAPIAKELLTYWFDRQN